MARASRKKRERRGEAGLKPTKGRAAPDGHTFPADDFLRRLVEGDGAQAATLFLLVAVFFYPAANAGFVWDDKIVTGSQAVRELSGLWQLWFEAETTYRHTNTREGHFWPVAYSTFWLEHKLWGFEPLGYHLVNVFLHFANTCLVWRLLRRLAVPGAWLAAAVFAVHPVHVEAVVWVIARKDLLSTLFYLLAASAWLRFVDQRPVGIYLLAVAAFIVAMLSKTMAVTLPAAMLVVCWWRTGRVTPRDLLGVAPFFGAGLALALHDMSFYTEMRGTVAFDYSLAERVLMASQAVWFYVGKLLWPVDLAVIYPRWEIDATSIRAWLSPVAGLAVAALLWGVRHRIGRGALAGAALFVVTLSPMLNLLDHYYMRWSFVADRYQYLASAAMAALFAAAAAKALEGRSHSIRASGLGCCVVVVAVLGTLTWRQAGIYRDDIVFNSHIVSLNPEALYAHMNLGTALFWAGRYEEALAATRTAITQRPRSDRARANAARELIALGRFDEAERAVREGLEVAPFNARLRLYQEKLSERRMYEKALESFEAATDSDSERRRVAARGALLLRMGRHEEVLNLLTPAAAAADPSLPQPPEPNAFRDARMHLQMSIAAQALGRPQEAAEHRRRALEIAPSDAALLHNFAESLREQGSRAEAIEWYGLAIADNPTLAPAYAGMGHALFEEARYEEAMERLERAEALLPPGSPMAPDLYRSIARTELARGGEVGAIRAYRRLLELAPRHQAALAELAALHFDRDEFPEALRILETLAEIGPGDANAQANLAIAYAGMGHSLYQEARYDESMEQLERAEALLPPGSPVALDLYRSIARTELARGREVGAIRAYRRLLELAPGHPTALAELAVLHFDQKEFPEALRILETLAEVSPDNPDVHANMGIVLGMAGRLEESLTSFERALVLDPASETTRSRRDAVRRLLATAAEADATDGT